MRKNLPFIILLAAVICLLGWIAGCGHNGDNGLLNLKPTRTYMARLASETKADFDTKVDAAESKVTNTINDLMWTALIVLLSQAGLVTCIIFIANKWQLRKLNGKAA